MYIWGGGSLKRLEELRTLVLVGLYLLALDTHSLPYGSILHGPSFSPIS